MTTLPSLTYVIPNNINIEKLITELEPVLSEFGLADKLEEIKDKYQQVVDTVNNFKDILQQSTWDSQVQAVFTAVDQLLVVWKTHDNQSYTQFVNSPYYQSFNTLKQQWSMWSENIGKQKKEFNEKVSYAHDHNTGDVLDNYSDIDLSFGLSVSADSHFSLGVLTEEEVESETALLVDDKSVLVGQEIFASLAATANAQGSYQIISLAAKAKAKGEIELDSYFQADKDQKTYSVLYAMYRRPLLPWSLKNMRDVIQQPDDDGYVENGYRAFSLRRNASLGLSGEIAIGKSISTVSEQSYNPVKVDVSAELGLSSQWSFDGKVELLLSKNDDDQLVIDVNLLERDAKSRALKFDLNASVQGFDLLVKPHIKKLLGASDDIIEYLEEYSAPGQKIVDKVLENVNDDDWYAPLVEVLLGETSLDNTLNKLVKEEIIAAFEQTGFSPTRSSAELAQSTVDKLLVTFSIDEDKIPAQLNWPEVKASLTNKLSDEIAALQTRAQTKAEEIAQFVQDGIEEQLEPLKRLSNEVTEAIENFDTQVTERFEKITKAYQDFKAKITSALEKSADIQLKLQYQSATSNVEQEQESFRLVIINPQASGVEKLYRSLVLGDDKSSSVLINKLAASGDVKYTLNSFELSSNSTKRVSLGIDVFGFSTTNVHHVVSDLVVKVGPSGRVTLVHKYNVSDVANGFDEKRSALFNLSYGIAAAALDEGLTGAIGFNYQNRDNKLHTQKEIAQLLDSLTLTTKESQFLAERFQPIISVEEANVAKVAYRSYTSSASSSKIRFPANKSHSELAVSMRSSADIFGRLKTLNGDVLFIEGLNALINAETSRKKRDKLKLLVEGLRAAPQAGNGLLDLYLQWEANGVVNNNEIKNTLRNTPYYEQLDKHWKILPGFKSLLRQAASLYHLVEELKNITDYIDTNVSEANVPLGQQEAEQLMTFLKASNDKMEGHLDEWIEVNSAFRDWFIDFASSFGVNIGGLNATLLSFMALLQDALRETDLYLVRIELARYDGLERQVLKVS